MKAEILPSSAKGTLFPPASKSMAHRMIISAALSEEESTIKGITFCEDVLATIDCLRSLGVQITLNEDGDLKIIGCDMKTTAPSGTLYCRESGSTLRFLIPIAALSGAKVAFSGTEYLMQRPLSVYEKLFTERGLLIDKQDRLLFIDGPLPSGVYTVQGNISSQFISGLLFALPLTEEDSVINILPPFESKPYCLLTIEALRKFGVNAEFVNEYQIKIPGNQKYIGNDLSVERDYSAAAFIDALNITGSSIDILGLSENSLQGDKVYKEYFDLLKSNTPKISIENCPDLGPILFILASMLNGAEFTGTARLKVKESDRAMAMAKELKKFGADIEVFENSVIVKKAELKAPKEELSAHNDHRIAMSLAVIASKFGGVIDGAESVNKSYPNFFEEIKRLGIKVNIKD